MRTTSMMLAVLCGMVAMTAGVATVYTPKIDPKKKTAVILANGKMKAEYKQYFSFLEKSLDVEYLNGDKKLVLKAYEEYHYENVIVFGNPSGKLGADFIDFVDSGRNVMIVATDEGSKATDFLTDELRVAAVDCGVEFTTNIVKDNFADSPTVLKADNFVKSAPIVGSKPLSAVTFKGVGLKVEIDNPLVTPILSAGKTAYVLEEETFGTVYGGNVALVAGLQSRIGSRAVFSGSLSMFSDKLFAQNGEFVKRITLWATQQHGILRYSDIEAVKLEDGQEVRDGEMFRIKAHIRFSLTIEEFDGEKGEWVPFVTPKDDPVQLEYTMIDPYVRADLTQKGTKHTTDLQAPDVYGIFKFVVDYRRTGYNPLVIHHQSPVRPLRLNEYERFIVAAYPYYLGTFSAMAGFILITFVFLAQGN
eukprot:TRINITY_DN24128_c0_g1_i1.p1 TRINITY_DN24128_c0_g1~~TRINITY_DN24128_c0_g1_i1.p1  ORF type:complete len:435 (+),score=163.57 TRINITY_DN24128_c0_g1_i1:54-1307(+)